MPRIRMNSHIFILLLVCAGFTYSKVHHISPSPRISCPQEESCLTLSQFATNTSSYHVNETSISLLFLPGNHSLDRELSLTYANNFSLTKDIQDNETVFIECTSQSGRFDINETTFASIKGLHFIGCGGNTVTQVDRFMLEDTIFQGVEGRGTALVLNVVSNASIVRSAFLSNTDGTISEHYLHFNASLIDRYYFESADLTYGGALYTAFSNVMIVDTNFKMNRAQVGAAIGVLDGNISISNSQFVNNTAMSNLFGGLSYGVILLFESKASIVNSQFTHNTAMFGGVLAALNSSIHVARSTYSYNKAERGGGVMSTTESSFSITNSTFTNNSAAINGGVMSTSESSFNITNSTFTNNSADGVGGVLSTTESSFNITNSTFTNNSAAIDGGVMSTSESSFNITNSTFTNNSADGVGGVMSTTESSFNKDSVVDMTPPVSYTHLTLPTNREV